MSGKITTGQIAQLIQRSEGADFLRRQITTESLQGMLTHANHFLKPLGMLTLFFRDQDERLTILVQNAYVRRFGLEGVDRLVWPQTYGLSQMLLDCGVSPGAIERSFLGLLDLKTPELQDHPHIERWDFGYDTGIYSILFDSRLEFPRHFNTAWIPGFVFKPWMPVLKNLIRTKYLNLQGRFEDYFSDASSGEKIEKPFRFVLISSYQLGQGLDWEMKTKSLSRFEERLEGAGFSCHVRLASLWELALLGNSMLYTYPTMPKKSRWLPWKNVIVPAGAGKNGYWRVAFDNEGKIQASPMKTDSPSAGVVLIIEF